MTLSRTGGASLAFALINESSWKALDASTLDAIAVACRLQANTEFSAKWGGSYIVRAAPDAKTVAPEEVPVYIRDTLPVADALGYHELVTKTGMPIAYVATKGVTSATTGPDALSTTISHEILETCADPTAGLWQQIGSMLIALEVSDEVEDQAYQAPNGVSVSDFLYRSYFALGAEGPFDHLKVLEKQLTETSGGYSIISSMPRDVHNARLAERGPHVSKMPRAHKLEKKRHPSSRTFRRGVIL